MRPSLCILRVASLAGLALAAAPTHAQRVAARSDLTSLLGATAVTEDFEDVTFAGPSLFLRAPVLNQATTAPGFPAGRIAPGLAFDNGNDGHEFFAARPDFGLASRTYVASSSEADILLAGGVQAVGLTMIARFFSNPQLGSVTFYGAGGRPSGASRRGSPRWRRRSSGGRARATPSPAWR